MVKAAHGQRIGVSRRFIVCIKFKEAGMAETKKAPEKRPRTQVLAALTGVILFLALVVVLSIFVLRPWERERWGNLPFANMVEENQEEIAIEEAAEAER
jgi:hypothetical protein